MAVTAAVAVVVVVIVTVANAVVAVVDVAAAAVGLHKYHSMMADSMLLVCLHSELHYVWSFVAMNVDFADRYVSMPYYCLRHAMKMWPH